MEEAHLAAEPLREVRRESVEAGVLGEDERLVAAGHRLEDLDEPLELARPPVERAAARQDELGMVAQLLELPEHRQHRPAPVEPALVLLDPRHPAVDRRPVEAGLLDGEPARDLGDRDRRQVELDLGRVLRAAEHERPDDRRGAARAHARRGRTSIGRANVRSNASREPSRPGLTRSMIAQSSPRRFSIGVPVRASARPRGIRRSARWRFVRGFFASCASSSSSRSHLDRRRALSTSRVATSYDVTTTSLAARRAHEGRARESGRPVMEVDARDRARNARSPAPTAASRSSG